MHLIRNFTFVFACFLVSTAFAQESANQPAPERTSPFDAIYIEDDGTITVTVGDVEGELVSVGGVTQRQILVAAQQTAGDRWKKRIAEDLGDVMQAATGERPEARVKIVMTIDGRNRGVESSFDAQKRAKIYDSDYGVADPRAEPIDPRLARAALKMVAAQMETRWSYRHLRPEVDIEAELLMGLDGNEQPTIADMAVATMRMLGDFDDGHARVRRWWSHASDTYPPFMSIWLGSEDRVAVMFFGEDGPTLADPKRPYLAEIDGRPVTEWLEAARRFETRDQQDNNWHATELLRFLPLLRRELDEPASPTAEVTVVNAEGEDRKSHEVELSADRPGGRARPWLEGQILQTRVGRLAGFAERAVDDGTLTPEQAEQYRETVAGYATLPDGVGYLQLQQMDDSPETLNGIAEAMEKFRDAPGLVIDIRSNGGGSRLPLLMLWRYLRDEGEPPQVVTLAKPILDVSGKPYRDLGGSRFMYAASSPVWSDAERQAVSSFAEDFDPLWNPGEAFGDWHYLVLGGDTAQRATNNLPQPYHFDKPVVVMMDGDCFSATSIFLAAMAMRDDVTLLGTPAPAGSGRVVSHRVLEDPDDFEVTLSTMASFMPDGRLFDRSVIEPDVEIWPTLEDLTGQTDTQLEAALESARSLGNRR